MPVLLWFVTGRCCLHELKILSAVKNRHNVTSIILIKLALEMLQVKEEVLQFDVTAFACNDMTKPSNCKVFFRVVPQYVWEQQ
jgi:hypothetical protein